MRHPVSKMIEWLGGHELTVLIGLFIVVTGTWGFIELADEVLEGETQAMDERILRALRTPDPNRAGQLEPIGPEWVEEMGRDVTALGGYFVLTLVTFAVAGFLQLDRKFSAMWFVLGAVVSGFVVMMGLKSLIERPRPPLEFHVSHAATSSFPSGHSMMAAVVYLTLGTLLSTLVSQKRLKFYFLSIAVLLAALVGCSRVYMGVHYPTDVLAGWTGGLTWATLCWLIARALQRRGRIDQEV